MNATGSKLLPAPPRLIASLMAGFDSITSHISLILFPLILDIVLWLGPRLKVERLFADLVSRMAGLPGMDTPDAVEMVRANQEVFRLLGERLNMIVSLRTYPVGIPSLMASRLPLEAPGGVVPSGWEIPNFGAMLGSWILLSLAGYTLGALFFFAVADASVSNRVRWSYILRSWPWVSFQSVLLALCWALLIIAISIPASCMIVFINLTSPGLARVVILLYGGFLIWLLFPLFFSPHGIFINRNNVLVSLKQGMFITRMTLPTTGLFFLSMLVINQGLDVLWQVPEESSWLTLIGLAGHAFITTGLLASSFIYYRDADRWMQSLRSQWANLTSH
jgi:hypothetical protein